MNDYIKLEKDTKAKIIWTFKDKEYFYSTINFILENMNLTVEIKGYKKKKRTFNISLLNKTAIEIINQYPEMGRHFELGIKQVFHDLGLSLGYNERILKEI